MAALMQLSRRKPSSLPKLLGSRMTTLSSARPGANLGAAATCWVCCPGQQYRSQASGTSAVLFPKQTQLLPGLHSLHVPGQACYWLPVAAAGCYVCCAHAAWSCCQAVSGDHICPAQHLSADVAQDLQQLPPTNLLAAAAAGAAAGAAAVACQAAALPPELRAGALTWHPWQQPFLEPRGAPAAAQAAGRYQLSRAARIWEQGHYELPQKAPGAALDSPRVWWATLWTQSLHQGRPLPGLSLGISRAARQACRLPQMQSS